VGAIALPPRHLILDLSGVTFLSSSGLALLIVAQSGVGGTLMAHSYTCLESPETGRFNGLSP
jgi:hypothetical protein